MPHRIERTWKQRLARAIPFGVGQTKPNHYRDMARVAEAFRARFGLDRLDGRVLSKLHEGGSRS
jgi:hypothetical protein